MRSTSAIALSALLLLPGCNGLVIGLGPTVVGSGVTKEETREVAPFGSVEVSPTFEATITIGPKQSVSLEVDDNLLPLVEVTVKDGQLAVGFASGSNISTNKPQKVAIIVPSLDAIAAHGSAKVDATVAESKSFKVEAAGASVVAVKGLSSDTVEVETSGAGRVSLAGKAKRLTLEASGATKLTAPDVTLESAKVDISGASRGEVNVTGSIDGEVSGASTLVVKGNPATRSIKTSGASRVTY